MSFKLPGQYNELKDPIGSYSSYIARKIAIENLNSITKCNYAKNLNFNIKNNKIIYSNNYQSLNKLNSYVRPCSLSTNARPLNI
jgi:hypothetical protein